MCSGARPDLADDDAEVVEGDEPAALARRRELGDVHGHDARGEADRDAHDHAPGHLAGGGGCHGAGGWQAKGSELGLRSGVRLEERAWLRLRLR